MELMSLLLFVLALVPQAFGKTSLKSTNSTKFNDLTTIKDAYNFKNTSQSKNFTVSFTRVSNLQSVFMDSNCKPCLICMERAIKAHKVNNRCEMIENTHHKDNIQKNKRDKRKTKTLVKDRTDRKSRKLNSKNNKTVNIIKYNDTTRVYALKISETSELLHQNKSKSSCQVYSIKKSFPCGSSEADIILRETKRKINKKSKKETTKTEKSTSDTKATVIAPVFRKRQIEESQALEQIMPSVEEMY